MHKVERSEQPDCLDENWSGWTKDFVAARKLDPKHPFRWRCETCEKEIRSHLARMTQDHCAFCDGINGVVSQKTVEHFHPKSGFPDLAYKWNNLFSCCNVCQSCKGEKFDEALLKPDEPEYTFDNYFMVSIVTGAIEPLPQLDESARWRAEVTIRLYGLNLPDRKKARIRELERYRRDLNNCNFQADLDDYNFRFFLERA